MPSCTFCSQDTPNVFSGSDLHDLVQPAGGLHVSVYPGYGMFTDGYDNDMYKALTTIRLCHDCSLKFIDTFPEEFKQKYFNSGHPVTICREYSDTHPDGCHYAWA